MGTARTQVAVARAQVAANQPAAARATLDAALVRVRDEVVLDIVRLEAVDVLVALGDEAAAAQLRDEADAVITRSEHVSSILRHAFEPDIDLESKLAVDALAELVMNHAADLSQLEVGSRIWQALVDKAVDRRLAHAHVLAGRAREVGKLDLATRLVERAARSPPTEPDDRLSWAEEAALCGKPAVARQLLTKLEPLDEPAVVFARIARIHAILGDAAASEISAKQALAVTPSSASWESERWRYLALARAKRGETTAVLGLEHDRRTDHATYVAFGLIEQGQASVASELAELLTDAKLKSDVTYMVVRDLVERGELEKARARADERSRSLVTDAYARAGNVAVVREMRPGDDALIDLAALRLARRGACAEALAALQLIRMPYATLAHVARYCPASKVR